MDRQLTKPIWVIKLGGSLLGTPALMHWLNIIQQHGDGRVVIVPGGSVFADAVREAQLISGINDKTAHQLALLAMDQYGLMLAGMNEGLVTASSELELAERSYQHRGIVWLPSKMVMMDEDIPQNWEVTSDSLSAWLAKKVNAKFLVLVKSANLSHYPVSEGIDVQQLIDDTVVDQQFGEFVDASTNNYLIWKGQVDLFQQGFDPDNIETHGLRVKG